MRTKKALLNSIQMVIDQVSRILVGFLLTPVLVTHLGAAGFGLWQIIQKTSLQLAALDGRAPEVLKWVIAGQQNIKDDIRKQRAFGSAVISFLVFLPLLVSAFAAFIVFLPSYMDIEPQQIAEIRFSAAMLGVAALLLVIATLFEAVIRGMNIAYKLAGVQAVVLVAGGVLSAYAAIYGLGIPGISMAQIIVSLLFILSYYYVARRNVCWLGIKPPSLAEIKEALKRSKWYTLWAFVSAWLFAGDIIVLGAMSEANIVSQYVLTMYVSQLITVAVLTTVASILPGLAGVIGDGDHQRARKLREESFLYSWWMSLAICSAVIVFNESFVALWVGNEHYAGDNINLLITVCIMQLVLIRHDANMLNLALDIKQKVVLGVTSAGISLALMLVLIPLFNIVGLCIALLLGRLVLQLSYPRIINGFLNIRQRQALSLRKIIATGAMLTVSWWMSSWVFLSEWWFLLFYAGLYVVGVVIGIYLLGINSAQKSLIQSRLVTIKAVFR